MLSKLLSTTINSSRLMGNPDSIYHSKPLPICPLVHFYVVQCCYLPWDKSNVSNRHRLDQFHFQFMLTMKFPYYTWLKFLCLSSVTCHRPFLVCSPMSLTMILPFLMTSSLPSSPSSLPPMVAPPPSPVLVLPLAFLLLVVPMATNLSTSMTSPTCT